MKYRIFIFIAFLINIFAFMNGWATTIIVKSFEKLVNESPLIIEAIVTDVNFNNIPNSDVNYANVYLNVINVIKGNCPDEILMRRYGVNKKFEYMGKEYDPTYYLNKRYIIFLERHPDGYYIHLGLYNGTYEVINGRIIASNIAGAEFYEHKNKNGISVEELKQQIKNILNDSDKNSSNDTSKVQIERYILRKSPSTEMISSLETESHFDGKFKTFDMTWNTNYLPIKFYYNPDYYPNNKDTVISRINNAFSAWNNLSLCNLDFQTISISDTTTEKYSLNTTNVIFWALSDESILATTLLNPDEPEGIGTTIGADISFNTYYYNYWYFGSTPPAKSILYCY